MDLPDLNCWLLTPVDDDVLVLHVLDELGRGRREPVHVASGEVGRPAAQGGAEDAHTHVLVHILSVRGWEEGGMDAAIEMK